MRPTKRRNNTGEKKQGRDKRGQYKEGEREGKTKSTPKGSERHRQCMKYYNRAEKRRGKIIQLVRIILCDPNSTPEGTPLIGIARCIIS
jgi:hypothetical protein